MLSSEQVLVDLLHDLAQPLGTIETSAYCLELAVGAHDARTQQYLRVIQQQVEQATGLLAAAAAELARSRSESFVMAAGASR